MEPFFIQRLKDAYHLPLLRVTLEHSERDAAVSAED